MSRDIKIKKQRYLSDKMCYTDFIKLVPQLSKLYSFNGEYEMKAKNITVSQILALVKKGESERKIVEHCEKQGLTHNGKRVTRHVVADIKKASLEAPTKEVAKKKEAPKQIKVVEKKECKAVATGACNHKKMIKELEAVIAKYK